MSLVKRDEAEGRLLPSHSSETALDNIELGVRADSDDDEGSPRYLMREGTGVKRAPSDHDFILELENVVEEVKESIEAVVANERKMTTFKVFLVLYALMCAPVLWFLFCELLTQRLHSPDVIPMAPSAVGLLGFMGTTFGLYAALRFCLGKMGWKQKAKSPAQHKEDLLRIGRLSAMLGVLGRVANRVHAPDGVFFLGLIVGYTVVYSCIYEVSKNLNIVLTRECVRNPFTLLVTAVTMVMISGVLALHVIFAAADRELVEFVAFLALGALFHLALFVGPGAAHVHVHHWYWAFAAAHMCVFDSRTSQLAQAMFCGCYIHGVALFGVERIFYASADENDGGGEDAL